MQPIDVVDNLDGEFADPSGNALPPCIVMERGESLDIWLQRAQPDWSQAFTVRTASFLSTTPFTPCSCLSLSALYLSRQLTVYLRDA